MHQVIGATFAVLTAQGTIFPNWSILAILAIHDYSPVSRYDTFTWCFFSGDRKFFGQVIYFTSLCWREDALQKTEWD